MTATPACASLPAMHRSALLFRIRLVLAVFILGLVASGLTAFPLLQELEWLCRLFGVGEGAPQPAGGLNHWLWLVRQGLRDTYASYPFMAYGTDWLAFAHLVIAVFFIGPWRDPVRNIWVVEAGMIACVMVIPLALICGPLRGIPMYWQLIDCSFGVLGILPLLWVWSITRRLETAPSEQTV